MIRSATGSCSPATTALWVWFTLGALACVCIPALRMRNPFWGWLPFWLVVAPLLDLAVLQRVRLGTASRALLARGRGRRSVQQARRLHGRRALFSVRIERSSLGTRS